MQSKMKKMLRSVLAFLTAFTMMLGMMPTTLMAEENTGGSGSPVGESGLHLTKTATLEDDGTYTINLEAYATGETTTTTTQEAVPLDIVLVLDQSGSMDQPIGYTYNEKEGPFSYKSFHPGIFETKTYYYLDEGEYYKVTAHVKFKRGLCYYLSYTKKGNTYYLSEDNVVSQMPADYTDDSQTIWNGALYERQEKSKLSALKEAVSTFVSNVGQKAVEGNVEHRIAMVGFASGENDYENTEILTTNSPVQYNSKNYSDALKQAFLSAKDDQNKLAAAIDVLGASGATRADLGMRMAENILNANSVEGNSNRKQLVIMFTDGEPNDYSGFDEKVANAAISESRTIKDKKATVYTIGVFDGATPSSTSDNTNKYMNYVSSNYPAAISLDSPGEGGNNGYYLAASSAEGLNTVFETISNTVTSPSTSVQLNSSAVMKDILSDDFTLPAEYVAGKNITVKTVDGITEDGEIFTWTDDELADQNIKFEVNGKTITVTGFDYADNYIAKGHGGKKLVVTIKGVIPEDSAATGEPVYTNSNQSGIYENSSAEKPVKTFPQPTVTLTNKAYVLDYAKPVTLNPEDWNMSGNGNINITGKFGYKDNDYKLTYGSLDNLVYTPKTTNWNGYDKFYAFGKTTKDEIKAQNGSEWLWSRVSVLPANNVYYEDDFVTNTTNGVVGIEYGGNWQTVTDSSPDYLTSDTEDTETTIINSDTENTETANTETANTEIHGGWQNTDLANDLQYSDGSAHAAHADYKDENGKVATATFTFSGTGVDIYSRTNSSVGKVSASLSHVNGNTKTVEQVLIMDNKSESGDYYQIPTLSFGPLKYGTYEVKLAVSAAGKAGTEERRGIYYLDGIRVYNPIQNNEKDDAVVQGAYRIDMLNATFTEVRDILLEPISESQDSERFDKGMVVFLDKIPDQAGHESSKVAEFQDYGPKNEVYLAKGQKIAFKVENKTEEQPAKYYVGLKAPAAKTDVKFTDQDNAAITTINHSTDLYYEITPVQSGDYSGCIVIENAGENLLAITKIYYNDQLGGIKGIQSKSNDAQEKALSAETVSEIATPIEDVDDFGDDSEFTDVPEAETVQSQEAPFDESASAFAAEAEETPEVEETVNVLEGPLVLKLVEYANLFDTLPEVPYEEEAIEETPESDQDENPEVEDPNEGNVDITNPEPDENQKPNNILSWLDKLFHGFNRWF